MDNPLIEILYKDDKKEKHQSHSFTIKVTKYNTNIDFNSELVGLGASEETAKANVNAAISELIKMLDIAQKQLNGFKHVYK